ncbi:hypothetical protein [Corynebacterium kutscheri]|uniref:hypothetical protein n=1 Tax=Corynebacterium kutscheri TaxID=35755 RepID=UPI000F842FBA|nr:hypothetical protein [Corynebacterium kutscheri]
MTINTAKIPEIIKVYGRMFLILWDEEAWFWGGRYLTKTVVKVIIKLVIMGRTTKIYLGIGKAELK